MKKLQKVLLVLGTILIVIGLFWLIVGFIPPYQVTDDNPWRKDDRTLISAHRGGSNLNPENTEMAFDYVILQSDYVDIVELDVRLTAEDELVIIHDDSVNDTGINEDDTSATEEVMVRNLTYNELCQYNLGINFEDRDGNKPYRDLSLAQAEEKGLIIMKLSEFFDKYNNARDFRLLLEIKDTKDDGKLAVDKAEELLALDKNAWWNDRVMIISFSTDVVKHTLANYPNRYVAGMGYNMVPFLAGSILGLDALFKIEFQSIQTSMISKAGPISINCATQKFVDSAHARNQCVAYWTIDDEEDMRHLISIGADVITTDSPDVLARVLGIIE